MNKQLLFKLNDVYVPNLKILADAMGIKHTALRRRFERSGKKHYTELTYNYKIEIIIWE